MSEPQVWRVQFAGQRKFQSPLRRDFCVLTSGGYERAVKLASAQVEDPKLISVTLVYGTRYCDKLDVDILFDPAKVSVENPASIWSVVGYNASNVRCSVSMLSHDPLSALLLWKHRCPGGRLDHVATRCLIHLYD